MPAPASSSELALPLSDRARRTRVQPIGPLMAKAIADPSLISFAAGLVDYDTLPVDLVRTATDAVLRDAGPAALQYGMNAGDPDLRKWLVEHLAELEQTSPGELGVTPADVVVTTGSQQALYLLTDVLVNPGDLVICGGPSYFVYTGLLESVGADVRLVDVDEQGMNPASLAAVLDEIDDAGLLGKLKLVYVQSYYDNPTGVSLSADRRKPIVDLVRDAGRRAGHRVVLLEDAAYRELGYDAVANLPSLKRYDPENHFVASCYTFSKPLAPGVKTGYAFLPTDLVDPVLQQKGNHDFGSPNLCQQILARICTRGDYARHLEVVRAGYRIKRDAMLAALDQHLAGIDGVRYTRPAGGMYVWLTLPEHVDAGETGSLLPACLDAGVLYVPGHHCFAGEGGPANTVRLCFGTVDASRIADGVARLAGALRDVMDQLTPVRRRNSDRSLAASA